MNIDTIQTSFGGGELAPALASRIDLSKYYVGASLIKNFIVRTYGGVENRPGTGYIESGFADSRLIPFQFSVTQAYALEFSDGLMRVFKDKGLVLRPLVKSGFYKWTATATPGEYYVELAAGGDPSLVEPSVVYEDDSEMTKGTLGSLAEGEWDWGDGGGGFNTVVLKIVGSVDPDTKADFYIETPSLISSPYASSDDLNKIRFTQDADTLYMAHPEYALRTLTRTEHWDWTFTTSTFVPSATAPTGLAGTVNKVLVASHTADYDYSVSAVVNGEESLPCAAVTVTVNRPWQKGDTVSLTWNAVSGVDYYRVYKSTRGYFGWIGDAEEEAFTDDYIDENSGDGPQTSVNPFVGADDYPGAVAIFQQRLLLGRTNNQPQTVWGSQTGIYNNLGTSRPLKDSDGLEVTIASKQVNEIKHIVPLEQALIFTSGAEWLMTNGGNSEALTPTSVSFKRQSEWGCSDVEPITVGRSVLFIQRGGQKIRDLLYQLEADGYAGNDLTVLAGHLFNNHQIVDWAYQQNPYDVLWCVRDDGVLLGLTYLREQSVWAWHQHETDGEVESICVVPGSNTALDDLYLVVKRNINGSDVRYVEYLSERLPDDEIRDAIFMDSSLSYDNPVAISGATQADPVVITATDHGLVDDDIVAISDVLGMTDINDNLYKVANATANTFELTNRLTGSDIDGTAFDAYTSGGYARKCITSVSGLSHLEGEEVAILADGNVIKGQTVTSGSVNLGIPAGRVHVGLGYDCDVQTLSWNVNSGAETVQNKKKAIHEVAIKFEKSRALYVGTEEDDLEEIKFREYEDYTAPIALYTGEKEKAIPSAWEEEGKLYMRVPADEPVPCAILAVIPSVEVGDV